ncbi:HMG box-containing protein 1 [Desmophyllum pertusum]|nr:HMG box-containing protein 1 [Desmophyllum pertusum]KAJ7375828.1 HMG box-containing protein 1 [Desmophyllum pertusum]
MFSPSWEFESTMHTVYHDAFPQTWHHAVTPQNFSGDFNLGIDVDVWFGDLSLIEGQNDAALISDESSNLRSTSPELTIEENAPASLASPISEINSQGSEELEEISTRPLQNGNTKTHVNHVKRPMNAFFLFSKQNRKDFQEMYPKKDNRDISVVLGKKWKKMSQKKKKPYKEHAKELMRRTRESHPDFKYFTKRRRRPSW